MKSPVDAIFPPMPVGQLPYWRLILRGCSQLAFQCNELTGLFILAGVAVASPISAAYLLVAATLAPAGRMLLGDKRSTLETGLPGLNPGFLALSLPAFYETGWTDGTMWAVLIGAVAVAVLLTRLCLAILPFPVLVLPFLIIFWTMAAVLPGLGILHPLDSGALAVTAIHPVAAVLHSLGQAIFSPNILSGLFLLAGVALSDWRHGILVLLGAMIGTVVSAYNRDVVDPTGLNLGLYGFNGIPAALAVFIFCGNKLRLAILGAILATILVPVIPALGVKALAAPFVLTTWFLLALGWIEEKWFLPPASRTALSSSAP